MRWVFLLLGVFQRFAADVQQVRRATSWYPHDDTEASGPSELNIRPGERSWLIARAVSLKAF
ncbi:MAG: hypothetical protein U1E45_13905 [Geminicoccaceae bacterium]